MERELQECDKLGYMLMLSQGRENEKASREIGGRENEKEDER